MGKGLRTTEAQASREMSRRAVRYEPYITRAERRWLEGRASKPPKDWRKEKRG